MMWEWYAKGGVLLRKLGAEVAVVNGVVPLRFTPKVAVVHGPLVGVTKFQRIALRLLYSTYDATICVSRASEREYSGIAKCNKIIPLPMRLAPYRPQPNRQNVVVHIGTRPVKNPTVSIEAVRILRERGHDVKLVIIGEKTREIESKCMNTEFCIAMYGLPQIEVIKKLCEAKAMILPSSAETFSYTTLEAMACGTPPVVSSAVPEDVVIHRYNGLRIDSLNPVEYADALGRLISDEELWYSISRNALEFVKRFDHLEVAKKYSAIFKQLTEVQGRKHK